MTTLIQPMREELVRRNYAESRIRSYLHTIEDFRRYAQKRLDHLGPGDIRALPGLLAARAQARPRNVGELCCRPALVLRQDAEASSAFKKLYDNLRHCSLLRFSA